jgi:uncharacterized protein (DUF608 family)
MYASRFESAVEVANHLAGQHDALLDRVLAWQQAVYGEEGLPGWLRDSLVNIFAVLAQQSFWSKSADPGHWWGDEGLFFVNESLLSCPQQACIANDHAAEWPVDIFFPDLARNKLRAFKHYQQPNGQTPSTLGPGTEPDQPWSDQQLPFDGQVYVQIVDRMWQVTGDRGVLEEFYESVKAGTRFMRTVDKDGDGIPDVKGSNQAYDNWPAMEGAAIHVATYWLATLRMVERMALEMGDDAFVDEVRGWFQQAGESTERVLWNEDVGSYLLYHNPATGMKSDSILCDQVNGQGYADLHGLPRVLPEERVGRAMETMWRYNVESTPHGARLAVRPDGSVDTAEGLYASSMIPSFSTLAPAMVLIYGGDRERGEELMRRAWRRMVIDLQRPWDMPCGLDADGNHLWGLEYYNDSMLWTLPVALLGQDTRTFSAPRGLRDRIVTAARP